MVKAAVSEYLDYATIHGLGRSKNSPFMVLKVLWILALCASLGVIAWQVEELYQKFDRAPISTSIELTTASQITFPGLVICNKNAVKFNALRNESILADVIAKASEKYSIDLSIFEAKDFFDFNYTAFDEGNEDNDINEDILWYTSQQFKMRMSALTDEQLIKMSQPLDEFILMCHIAGLPCSNDSFTPHRTHDYGMCYSFKVLDHTVGVVDGKLSGTGPRYALELLVNVGQDDSLPFVTSSSGVVISIEHVEFPYTLFDTEEEIFIPTGFEASIGLTQTRLERVPGKRNPKRCNEEEDAKLLVECKRECVNEYVALRCGCLPDFYNVERDEDNSTLEATIETLGLTPCYTEENFNCTNDIFKEMLSETPAECKHCLSPCKLAYFEKDVAMFTWPSDPYLPVLRRILQSRYTGWVSSTTTRDFVRGNLAMIRIYLKTLTFQTLKEEYSYTTVNFISDIGGQLGLWAGFSVLSVLEIVELLLIMCAKAKTKRNKTDATPSK